MGASRDSFICFIGSILINGQIFLTQSFHFVHNLFKTVLYTKYSSFHKFYFSLKTNKCQTQRRPELLFWSFLIYK